MSTREHILGRLYVVLTLLALVPLLVAGQVVRLQVFGGAELRTQGKRQATAFVPVPAQRGAIRDRAGRALVVNSVRYRLALDPTTSGFADQAQLFFEELSKRTGRSPSFFSEKAANPTSPQYVVLLHEVEPELKEDVERWGVPGVLFEEQYTRRYNYGRTAAHLLGFTDRDGAGIAGLELQYEAHLRGEDGRRAARRDRSDRLYPTPAGRYVEPHHGEDLVLTIDLIRQTVLEEELRRGVIEQGANWGTALALDPHTGAILAMATVPDFDPNQPPLEGDPAQRNRAVTDRIEPGSTFKLVAAVAAVEQGVVAPGDSVETGNGWITLSGRTLRDTRAHGTITFADVIAQSSNVGTAKTALLLEPGAYYQYARSLGFGQPTLVDLPGEVGGALRKPSDWSRITQPWMSIGYALDATPLQIATAYAALANGGLLVQPHIVAERRDARGRTTWTARPDSVRRAFRPSTAKQLWPMFERAVQVGTARRAQVEGLRIAGKTGTAQKARAGGYDRDAYRASFVGFFPVERPEVVLLVVLDEPRQGYGGVSAAPVFQRIAQRWVGTFPRVAQRMAPADTLPTPRTRSVPDVRGQLAHVAAQQLRVAGFRVDPPRRPEQRVAEQRPAPGKAYRLGRRVRLDTAPAEATPLMPDVTGLSGREALALLAAQGIETRLHGDGVVVRQVPAAGQPAQRATLTCRTRR